MLAVARLTINIRRLAKCSVIGLRRFSDKAPMTVVADPKPRDRDDTQLQPTQR